MVKTERPYLIGAGVCGCVGIIVIIASFSTQYWLSADLSLTKGGDDTTSPINHGLFTGTLTRKVVGAGSSYTIYLTCLFDYGVCAWSCANSADERELEVRQLYENSTWTFRCTPIASTFVETMPAAYKENIVPTGFTQAGLWVAGVFFLGFSLLSNIIAFGFNIYNVFNNPIETYASTTGLYIYYSISACSTLLAMILLGVEFNSRVAIPDVVLQTLTASPTLSWSFYLLIVTELSQLSAIGSIYYRQFIIHKKEAEKIIKVDDTSNDANTVMY